MAETKISSVADMDNGLADETKQFFMFFPAQYAIDNGTVADPENVTWQERAFVQSRIQKTNNLDAAIEECVCSWKQVTLSNFPGFTDQPTVDAFLAGIKVIFDQQRSGANLVPA